MTLPNCHYQIVTFLLLPICHYQIVTFMTLPNCHNQIVTFLLLPIFHYQIVTFVSLPNCRYQIVTLPNCHYQIVITKLSLTNWHYQKSAHPFYFILCHEMSCLFHCFMSPIEENQSGPQRTVEKKDDIKVCSW